MRIDQCPICDLDWWLADGSREARSTVRPAGAPPDEPNGTGSQLLGAVVVPFRRDITLGRGGEPDRHAASSPARLRPESKKGRREVVAGGEGQGGGGRGCTRGGGERRGGGGGGEGGGEEGRGEGGGGGGGERGGEGGGGGGGGGPRRVGGGLGEARRPGDDLRRAPHRLARRARPRPWAAARRARAASAPRGPRCAASRSRSRPGSRAGRSCGGGGSARRTRLRPGARQANASIAVTRALVALADARQEQALERPRARRVGQVRARHEDRVVRGRPRREGTREGTPAPGPYCSEATCRSPSR